MDSQVRHGSPEGLPVDSFPAEPGSSDNSANCYVQGAQSYRKVMAGYLASSMASASVISLPISGIGPTAEKNCPRNALRKLQVVTIRLRSWRPRRRYTVGARSHRQAR